MNKSLFLFVLAFAFFSPGAHAQESTDAEESLGLGELFDIELKPDQSLILITIKDNRAKPMDEVIISVQGGPDPKPLTMMSDKDGIIRVIVPAGRIYTISFLSLDVSQNAHTETFDIPDEDEMRYTLDMVYTPPTTNVFVLEGVYFDTGKSILKPESYPNLETLLAYMRLKKKLEIELSGHTDNVGKPRYNKKLSEDRAKAVRDYLVSKGVEARRITAKGYGDTRPVASNKTQEGRSKNRRTEVRIVKQ